MRGILEALVTVELQLRSDFFFSLGNFDCTQNKIYILLGSGFVGNNTVVVQISDDRQIQYPLLCVYVRNIRNPFLVWSVRIKISVK